MNIRTVNKADLSTVLKLNEKAIPAVNKINERDLEWFLEKAEVFIVGEVNMEIVGFMIVLSPGLDYESLNYKYFIGNYKSFSYVDRIVIDSDYQHKGHGSTFYKYLELQTSAPVICCEINIEPLNEQSIAFHAHNNFKEVARQVTEDGNKMVSLQIKKL